MRIIIKLPKSASHKQSLLWLVGGSLGYMVLNFFTQFLLFPYSSSGFVHTESMRNEFGNYALDDAGNILYKYTPYSLGEIYSVFERRVLSSVTFFEMMAFLIVLAIPLGIVMKSIINLPEG